MKPCKQLKKVSASQFKRATGLSKENFQKISTKVSLFIQQDKEKNPAKKRGRKSTGVPQEDRILLVLYYLRHYPTFENLANVFGISESYCHKIYSRYRNILVQVETLPNRKQLLEDAPSTLAIDVTEQAIERPVKGQRAYYSGKKRHTIKVQLVICVLTLAIYSVVIAKGKVHDFRIYKESNILLASNSKLLADLGYQGLLACHKNSNLPVKRKKKIPLTKKEKAYNKSLSKQRILIEHINRRCKIFRIAKDVYRGKHKNYGLTWRLVTALVNLRYNSI